jgi:hypothetical protein
VRSNLVKFTVRAALNDSLHETFVIYICGFYTPGGRVLVTLTRMNEERKICGTELELGLASVCMKILCCTALS